MIRPVLNIYDCWNPEWLSINRILILQIYDNIKYTLMSSGGFAGWTGFAKLRVTLYRECPLSDMRGAFFATLGGRSLSVEAIPFGVRRRD
jgi:hypothetical protein